MGGTDESDDNGPPRGVELGRILSDGDGSTGEVSSAVSKASIGVTLGMLAVVSASAVIAAALIPNTVRGHGTQRVVQAVAASAPAPARPAPMVSRPSVAPAAPTSFLIKGPAFEIKAGVCQMPYVRPLDPPGEQHHTVCWVNKGFGVAPGSDSHGTSYILGHAWAEDANEVLNPLSIYAMNHVDMSRPVPQNGVPTYQVTDLQGYTITLRTPRGTLTYTVKDAYAVAKMQAAQVASLMNTRTPNRVVLITCGVHDGQDIDVNVIVEAYL